MLVKAEQQRLAANQSTLAAARLKLHSQPAPTLQAQALGLSKGLASLNKTCSAAEKRLQEK